MSRPTAAPAHFPYAHRTQATIRAVEAQEARTQRNRTTVERNDEIRRLIRTGTPDDAILAQFGIGATTLNKLRGAAW